MNMYIVMSGPPGSGKSLMKDYLLKHFKENGVKCDSVPNNEHGLQLDTSSLIKKVVKMKAKTKPSSK